MGDRLAAADQQQQPQQDDLMSSYQERIVADRVQAEKMERQQTVARLQEQIQIEKKIKQGAEMMIQVYESSSKGTTISKEEVTTQLAAANKKINALTRQIEAFSASDGDISSSSSNLKRGSGNEPLSPRSTRDMRHVSLPKAHHTSTNGDGEAGGGGIGASAGSFGNINGSNPSSPKLGRRNMNGATTGSTTNPSTTKTATMPLGVTTALISKQTIASISDILLKIRNPTEAPHVRLDCMNNLLKIMRTNSDEELGFPLINVIKGIRYCLVDSQKEMRANGFRFLRHIIGGPTDRVIDVIYDLHVDLFLIRALTRDQRYDIEREQAIRLIRSLIELPYAAEKMPHSIVRTLIAVAEQPDDKFKLICLETLCELAITNPAVVALCGGFKVLIPALIDGPKEIGETILFTMVYILDKEESRSYVRPSVEIEIILSHFTDVYGKGQAHEDKLNNCAKAIVAFLRTWTGSIYFCLEDKRTVRSIVEALKQPNESARKILLDMLFEVFLIEMPKWYPDFVSSRIRTAYSLPSYDDMSHTYRQQLTQLYPNRKRMNLVDQYQTFILVAFIDAGLLEALIDVIQDANKYMSSRATILIGEIRDLCNQLLPGSFNVKINSLPTLLQVASNFDDETKRHGATLAITQIDFLQANKERFLLHAVDDTVARRWLARSIGLRFQTKPYRRLKKQGEELKIKLGSQMDDSHYKNLLVEAEAPSVKEFSKWNWDGMVELINGPLQNPRRLDDALKNYKFLRRLIAFYRPSSRQFSDITKGKNSYKYVKIGCELLSTLLMNIDGMRALMESKLLQDIAECLAQLDPFIDQPDVLFSKDQMSRTLTSDYFTLLGTLCKHVDGHRLLERGRIFTTFYHISELRNRDDMIKAMLTSMDYSIDGHPRIILSKIMTSGSTPMRVFATNHLRFLLRTNVTDISHWGIQLLITQLYDLSAEVCERAVDVLDESFDDPINLESAIKLKPMLLHLGNNADPLLLRFMSTSSGFRFMNEMNYVEHEMDEWYNSGNRSYVAKLESNLARALWSWKLPSKVPVGSETALDAAKQNGLQSEYWESNSTVPPHFYGELTKTPEGCQLLKSNGHFTEFAYYCRNNGLNTLDDFSLQKLKACIWAIGHVGSNANGIPFLLEENVLQELVNIALETPVLSLKGTCYYAFGMISRTHFGAKMLDDLGWEAVSRNDGNLSGLCVPREQTSFLNVPAWKYKGSWADRRIKLSYVAIRLDSVEQEAVKQIGNMANHILANQASKTLSKLRYDNPITFTKIELYLEVLRIVSTYHYRLTARRFIQDLFDRVQFNDSSLAKLDELKGLVYEVRGAHWSLNQQDQDDDELAELMLNCGNISGSRRGLHTGSIGAVKVAAPKEEKMIMKPLKVVKGFG